MLLKPFIIPTLLLSLALSGCGTTTQGALPAEKPPVNVQNTGNAARIQNAQAPSGNAGQTNQWQWQVIPWQPNQQQAAPWQPAPRQGTQPPAQQQPAQAPTTPAPNASVTLSAAEQQMLTLVNQERQRNGLSALTAHPELTRLARVKSQDMITGNYFSHQSPTHGSPFDMIRNAGVSFSTAGENIAGNQSVDGAHTALMNSPGHRANILSNEYSHIGIGIVSGGAYGNMFTQMFIKP
ncbi:CAP domain-containing protein [Ammoniphilus sp. CFH 90114]|uniref:CAP domain-containing protein n=1 Tax=Ammoniphilus sp. CFH 90114 TaxID=2493665 RepID=UPI00100F8A6E|nr:CAP domain-containing protein [Ammoniphilus sp. CFH 90114]RXT08163.1 hypothetical protein EIZ39_12240 [Ammoniphilus sp. CFH 90114]